jgi:hypothetical protein
MIDCLGAIISLHGKIKTFMHTYMLDKFAAKLEGSFQPNESLPSHT